jgi:hypothetical protein
MSSERRSASRTRVDLFANQYIDGVPHLADVLELSMTGALVRRVHSPDADRAGYAIELASEAGPPMWLCASSVWRHGDFEAIRFVETSALDKLRLANVLDEARRAA